MVNMNSLWNGFLDAKLREILIMEECLTRLCSLSPHSFIFFILLLLHGCVSQSLSLRKFKVIFGNQRRKLEVWSASLRQKAFQVDSCEHQITLTGKGPFFNSVLFPFLCLVSVMFHLHEMFVKY